MTERHFIPDNRRIARNTLLLYVRMIFVMLVSLYTSRLVLDALGVVDYGIYNVVGGFVVMFNIVSQSLSTAISRFIAFELGRNDSACLQRVFSTSVNIQIIIAVVVCIMAEIGGLWFINNKMTLPPERISAAVWVLHFSVITFAVSLVSVPYNAAIIAHERMSAFAYISILEVLMKLAIVFALYNTYFDHLIVYGCLMMVVSIVLRLVYGIYCKKHFAECVYSFRYDHDVFRSILGFASWSFIGASAGILRDYGVNMVINVFAGPAVNAARAIAMQINSAVHNFASNFMMAVNPQITKSYASGNMDYMQHLAFQSAKLSYLMLFALSLPIVAEAETILSMWLVTVPPITVSFVRLVLIFALLESLSVPLITSLLATGKIRNYQILVGGIQLLNFPLSYLWLQADGAPEYTIVIAIITGQFCLAARLFMLKGMLGWPIMSFLNRVYSRVLAVSIIASIVPIALFIAMPPTYVRLIIQIPVSVISASLCSLYIGCTQAERNVIYEKASQIINKFRAVS